tara:strand:+ start:6935 stop:7849 length:915 start_codon:yes stop_codon:yes gene_type:complete
MESQCVGLAEKLGLNPELKRIAPRFPWSILPPQFWIAPLSAAGDAGDQLAPPWPDILIATGRQTVAPALGIKKANAATFAIQLQNPTFGRNRFDLVIVPKHDQIAGENVVQTSGALHGVTQDRLKEAHSEYAQQYGSLPRPVIGVLIGGTNKTFHFTENDAERLSAMLCKMAEESGGSLAITPSRRSGDENIQIIKNNLSGQNFDLWNGSGNNPYFGILAHADAFVVTGDSVNMVSEAIATEKPVYVYQLTGGSAKFSRFHDEMESAGKTRPFTGQVEIWESTGTNDMTIAAKAVKQAWDSHKN